MKGNIMDHSARYGVREGVRGSGRSGPRRTARPYQALGGLRAAAGATSRRYAEGLEAHEHEGAMLQCRRWGVACCIRLRPEAPCHPARGGRQSRGGENRFYQRLIKKADERFDNYRK